MWAQASKFEKLGLYIKEQTNNYPRVPVFWALRKIVLELEAEPERFQKVMKTAQIVTPVYRKTYKCKHCNSYVPQKNYSHDCPSPEASEIERAPVKDISAHMKFVSAFVSRRYNEVVST